jgi:hypothetical protein
MQNQNKLEFRATLATAKKDEEFIQLMKEHCHGFRVPDFWSATLEEKIFCILYQGYLLGKHQDDPKKYLIQ